MPQLDSTWFASQIFWLAITFIALYALLARLILPPLQDVIARRRREVDSDIAQAQRLKSQAEQARQDYERMLAEARQAAQKLVADALAEHKADAEARAKKIDKQLEQQLAESSRKIAVRKQQLLEALTPTSAELTALIVEKLTQHAPSHEQIGRILNEILKNRRAA